MITCADCHFCDSYSTPPSPDNGDPGESGYFCPVTGEYLTEADVCVPHACEDFVALEEDHG